jgi:hypothetical protein
MADCVKRFENLLGASKLKNADYELKIISLTGELDKLCNIVN